MSIFNNKDTLAGKAIEGLMIGSVYAVSLTALVLFTLASLT